MICLMVRLGCYSLKHLIYGKCCSLIRTGKYSFELFSIFPLPTVFPGSNEGSVLALANIFSECFLFFHCPQHFDGLVKDLYMVSDKFTELRSHMGNAAEAEELRQTNRRVLNVFQQLYWQVGVGAVV